MTNTHSFNPKCIVYIWIFLFMAGLHGVVLADSSFTQSAKLTASDGRSSDGFGFSVAVDGDTAVVSSNSADIGGTGFDRGAAYVFKRRGLSWVFQQKLTASDGENFDYFGFQVAISGDTIAVSTTLKRVGNNTRQGAVYVFVRNGSNWTQQQKITASDGAAYDSFGGSLSISGNTMVVGASSDSIGSNSGQGSAYVFVRNGNQWIEQAKLIANDGSEHAVFGGSVSIDGDYVVIGAGGETSGASFTHGAAYIFQRNGAVWTQKQKLSAEGAYIYDNEHFGTSVAIDDGIIAVGSPDQGVSDQSQQGVVYIFSLNENLWVVQSLVTAVDGTRYDRFGSSVAIDNQIVLVGAPDEETGDATSQGSAYIFTKQPNAAWTQQTKLYLPSGYYSEFFGQSVSIDNTTVLVGAVNSNNGFGAAYVFEDTTNIPDLRAENDSGISNTDNITNNRTLTFDINNVQVGATVELLRNSIPVGSIVATGNTVSITDFNIPGSGNFRYSVRQILPDSTVLQNASTVVAIDTESPTVSINQAVGQVDPAKTLPVNFTAVFSEPVFGFASQDISLSGSTANISNANVSITGNSSVYNIAVSNIISDGQIVQTAVKSDAVQDDAGNSNAFSTSTDNQVIVDNVKPSVSIDQSVGQSDPSTTQPINFTVVFSEPVTGFNSSDVSLANSTANVSTANIVVTGSGTIYNVAVSNITSSGLVRASVIANAVQDALGNLSNVSTSTDNTIVFNLRKSSFDFDGDGKSDLSVFRPANGIWYLNQSQNGFTGTQFGASGDKLVPADYDGDGKTDVAVYRAGNWYLQRSAAGFTNTQFGESTDIPLPADFDADGKADLAVYRPSNGTWYVQRSSLGFFAVQFGQAEDKPVAADFDADGKADLAVFRPSTGIWYIQQSTAGFSSIQFGSSEDKLVVADYDGDGKADLAVFRPSNGFWYLNRSQLGFTGIQFGQQGDIPVPADYDGDGKTDIGVYRNDTWLIQRSTQGFTGVQFGGTGDQPAPNAFVR